MPGEVGVYLDELDERETAPGGSRRTVAPYATFGPGDGRDWHTYFVDLKASMAPAGDEDEDEAAEDDREVEVLEPARLLAEEERAAMRGTSRVRQLDKRLTAAGWDVRVFRSLANVPPVLYLSDSKEGSASEHRKGDVRFEGYELETLILAASKKSADGAEGLYLRAVWTSKDGFCGATTSDPFLGREWRPTSDKPRKPRAWEKDEGVEPPLGLKQWLDIVAPTAATKAKKAAKTAGPTPESDVWLAA